MARSRVGHSDDLPFSRAALHSPQLPGYTGESLAMISFPLGGIGTGTIGLGGRGELRDWEIFNSPNLGYRPPYTMPYIFCKQAKHKVAKVLERKLLPPYYKSHGLPPGQFAALPRLDEAVFVGTYPVARIYFQDGDLPVSVQLEAFNPMIPGKADDSAIPAAVLIYTVTNTTRKSVSGSIAISMANTVGLAASRDGLGRNVNAYRGAGEFSGIWMTGKKHPKGKPGYGSEALVTTAKRVSYATDLDEPGWFDKAQKLWDDYAADGRLDGPTTPTSPSDDGKTRVGVLAAGYNLKPGATTQIVFIITWSFPTRVSGWHFIPAKRPRKLANHYAVKFPDAWTAARYIVKNFRRLREETLRFEQTLFGSTLPGAVLDAVSSQMSTIRTNTTMWLDSPSSDRGGRIFAFEGCSETEGCCPMNCTHVWNYEQSMAHLYPSLERTMRVTDYEQNVHRGGAMVFRTTLPVGGGLGLWNADKPAADGQFGTVVKVHREWRISGDDKFLKRLWPAVKESIEFAWKGFAKWDADRDGVLEGIQHNTYDIDFFGPNTMCGSLYLAALLAGAEMADAVGDPRAAKQFRKIFASGSGKYDRMLFNGEYYVQRVTESDRPYKTFWGKKIPAGRPKYQYARGCLSDQLLGQWTAHVAGLGYVLPPDHVRKALRSIMRYNFEADLSDHNSVQRTYALNEEAGLLNCTWPKGRREKYPFPYSDEVWTGIEYQVAAHMIYEGFIDEGLALVAAVRDRHDGVARNPWNEFECGDHYARAMASWSLLLALSGQWYDGRAGRLTMKPVISRKDFACIFTGADAYGLYSQTFKNGRMKTKVEGRGGSVALKGLNLAWPLSRAPKKVLVRASLNRRAVKVSAQMVAGQIQVLLSGRIRLRNGDVLEVVLREGRAGR